MSQYDSDPPETPDEEVNVWLNIWNEPSAVFEKLMYEMKIMPIFIIILSYGSALYINKMCKAFFIEMSGVPAAALNESVNQIALDVALASAAGFGGMVVFTLVASALVKFISGLLGGEASYQKIHTVVTVSYIPQIYLLLFTAIYYCVVSEFTNGAAVAADFLLHPENIFGHFFLLMLWVGVALFRFVVLCIGITIANEFNNNLYGFITIAGATMISWIGVSTVAVLFQ